MEQILRDSFTGLPFYTPAIGLICFAGCVIGLVLFTLILKDILQPKFNSLMEKVEL